MQDVLKTLEDKLVTQYENLMSMKGMFEQYSEIAKGAEMMGLNVKMLPFTLLPLTKKAGRKTKDKQQQKNLIKIRVMAMLRDKGESRYGYLTDKFYGTRRPLVKGVLTDMVSDGVIQERKDGAVKFYSMNGEQNASPSRTQVGVPSR